MHAILTQTWSWWFSGTIIASILFFLLYFGESFGFSANLSTICAAAGLGKKASLFNFNWKTKSWNLVFLLGAVFGGFIARHFLSSGLPVPIAAATIRDLARLGFAAPSGMQPNELFSTAALFSFKGFSILAIGGLLIGFGTRYAGGCTSGHAISGLANLQLPSFIAVIGFFIGGLIMSFLIFPLIF